MSITLLRGPSALSPFRAQAILERAAAQDLPLVGLRAQYVHLADLAAPLTGDGSRLLAALLQYGEAVAAPSAQAIEIAVVPRLGTVSPWSSKASEIARVCGLENLQRLERGIAYFLETRQSLTPSQKQQVLALIHDPLTESVLADWTEAEQLFLHPEPRPLRRIPLLEQGREALETANRQMGLALSGPELDYLQTHFRALERNPSDAELMMFAQANSEHCRHKIFNARFRIGGKEQDSTLFGMIRETHQKHPRGTLSAYSDNAAVMEGWSPSRYFYASPDGHYTVVEEDLGILMKVETHNHPTAISPFPGAATGSGGEIRDEGATGRGGKPKMGLVGFSVSHLRIPGFLQSWEAHEYGRPQRIRSPLEIMIEAPVGAAAFNNEFGRPAVAGYFRVFEMEHEGRHWGYHKPIMLAGGLGQIRPSLVQKMPLPVGAKILVIGGPALLIGLGGGAASSLASGSGDESLDFASVQRGNPEMQRRAQEVIERCIALGEVSPILSIHDVGAGGLSNAIPELLHDGGRGGYLQLRAVPNEDPAMSPMEIWCNEAQERYVLAVAPDRVDHFLELCGRERCPAAVLGETVGEGHLRLDDTLLDQIPVDMDLEILLGCPPRTERDAQITPSGIPELDLCGAEWRWAAHAVLRHPSVASKEFLIHIGDRSVGGLVSRDQMVGPWQVPVADCAVAASDFWNYHGEAMAIGERSPVAVTDAPASGRLAVAEALTNLFAADIADLGQIKLSANWMAAVQEPGEDARLFETVRSVAREICPALHLSIPVGKDSLSMQTLWNAQDGGERRVISPLSLVISAFAPVRDIRGTWTPQLQARQDTVLWLLDLGRGRLGASVLAQVLEQAGGAPADLDDPTLLARAFDWLQALRAMDLVFAYHDRSDGGLWAALCEMSFAGRCGVEVHTDGAPWPFLFSEEPGIIVQTEASDAMAIRDAARDLGLESCLRYLGPVLPDTWRLRILHAGEKLLDEDATELVRIWSEPGYRIQELRDDPACAAEAFASSDSLSPRLFSAWAKNRAGALPVPLRVSGKKVRVAILREEGVNGHVEMAAAFHRAGFAAVDIHMSDLLSGREDIRNFPIFAACGGFSYGDVLGAGAGWAKSILYHGELRKQFEAFLHDPDRLALGVCNGCQMLAELASIIPGTAGWPKFRRNRSEQFEARLLMAEVLPSPSPFFSGLTGLKAPIVVAHGEGRAEFASQEEDLAGLQQREGIILRYAGCGAEAATRYPENPNGSPAGIAGVCNADGRVSILMPHPERAVRSVQMSWCPPDWGEDTPWMEMFRNAWRVLA